MSMQLSHLTLRDETLTHQVIFVMVGATVHISCNCRIARENMTKGSRPHNHPIGPTVNIEESRRLYNDPVNHFAPFSDEDKAQW